MIGPVRKGILIVVVMLLPVSVSTPLQAPVVATASAATLPPGCDALSAALGAAQAAAANKPPAFNVANLDRSVSPCNDFFQFAAGGWVKNNPIPPEYSRWGTFNILQQHNEDLLRSILEDASQNPKKDPAANWQKIGDFYASCMDEQAIEAAGTKPLDPEFVRIAAIKDVPALEAEIAHLDRDGVNAVLNFGSAVDFKDSTMRIAEADQGGLGLPDRDYYTKEDAKSKALRDEYVAHMQNMFKLLGDDPAKAAAESNTVLKLETALAQASMKREDLRDPDKVYHKMTLAEMKALTPHFAWAEYIEAVGSPKVESANIAQPDFFKGVDAALAATPLDDWKVYLRWQLLHSVATALPKAFVDENFAFYGKTLTGAQQIQPRWRRCVRASDAQLGEALGQYYVKQAFPPEAKKRALDMVHNLMGALKDDLQTLDWMSPATRQKATEKLDAFLLKIGYPDKWRDYSGYKVTREAYVINIQRGNAFETAYDLGKVGKKVDRTEWEMTPPTVNAYYDPTLNEIVFPAGILQPPFFNPDADDAINYGGIGAVIGHEMTHGFDDEGAKFDAKGNLSNWWTDADYKNFQARGDCIVKEFDAFEVEPADDKTDTPALRENGKLVEGESIADLGGLVIAYRAYRKTLEGKPDPAPIDGFTADQRFFLGYGQIWASSIRIQQARVFVATDPHPIPNFRVNGTLSNVPAFAKAFNCPANSPMARGDAIRCQIW
jgi:predicted metalloendopeptidase